MMPDDSSFQQSDICAVWDHVAATYEEIDSSGPDYQAYHQRMIELIGSPKGRHVCEVGCGAATTSAFLARLGARITLVDLSQGSLAYARQLFEKLGMGVTMCRANGLAMGFRDGAFDIVWNGGVIEHFTDNGKVALLQEMWRVTRPGGLLLVTVPNAHDWPFILGKAIARWRGKWIFGFEDDLSVGRFRRLAERAGIPNPSFHAHNPIVGWWFLPWGRGVTRRFGLDTLERHARVSRFGHVLALLARKPI
ncbi:MAG: hypothetical protein A2V88_13625 [Elusimicrobia bacterium RBG_16_66_12]|nr:MAG: hypothetical protein A2V88_13625 [Elusimicrobia bacterium RBG_16_66_12]